MSMEPLKGVMCLFHQVIVFRKCLLGDDFWGIAKGCMGVKDLLEAKGRKKALWKQDYLDNCLNLVTVNIVEKH